MLENVLAIFGLSSLLPHNFEKPINICKSHESFFSFQLPEDNRASPE